jgi:hypothetical protein
MCRHRVSYSAHYAQEFRRHGRFFSPDARDMQSNEVNSRRAWHWAHQGIRSCQCQAIPAMGGMTTQRSDASSLMSLFARFILFHLRGEAYSGIHPFEVCITETHCLFGSKCFLGPSPSLCDLKCKDCFLKHFPSLWDLLNQPSRFFGIASCTTVNRSRDSFGFIRCHLIIRFVDSDPSNYYPRSSNVVLSFELWTPIRQILYFRPAAPLAYSSSGFRSHGSPFYNISLCYEVCTTFGLLFKGVCHNLPSLCIQAISTITMTCYGHQSPDSL